MYAVGVGGRNPSAYTFTDRHAAVKFAGLMSERGSLSKVAEITRDQQIAGLKACQECASVFSRLRPDGKLTGEPEWLNTTYCTAECGWRSCRRRKYGG